MVFTSYIRAQWTLDIQPYLQHGKKSMIHGLEKKFMGKFACKIILPLWLTTGRRKIRRNMCTGSFQKSAVWQKTNWLILAILPMKITCMVSFLSCCWSQCPNTTKKANILREKQSEACLNRNFELGSLHCMQAWASSFFKRNTDFYFR